MCLHYTILAIKAELDQLVNGLQTLGVLTLLRDHPNTMHSLFVYSEARPMTAGDLFDMFPPHLSAAGSNSMEREEDQLMKWLHFLEYVEGD